MITNSFRNLRFSIQIQNGTNIEGFRKSLREFRFPNVKRSYMGQTYEGTGKTIAHVVNRKGAESICIDTINERGFMLSSGLRVVGPTIFFPHTMISWNIQGMNDISEESLSLFSILNPKLDVLFLGLGRKQDITFAKMREVADVCRRAKINYEIMPSADAAAAFNFCSLDRRFVAAALIPPCKVVLDHGLNLIEDTSNLPRANH